MKKLNGVQLELLEAVRIFTVQNIEWKLEVYDNMQMLQALNVCPCTVEGVTVALCDNETLALMNQKPMVGEGIIEPGNHIVIDVWADADENAATIERVIEFIQKLLNAYPNAVLLLNGNAEIDYNPISAVPEHPEFYTTKISDADAWKKDLRAIYED